MKHAVIVSAARTAGRQGAERQPASTRPDDMAAAVIAEALDRAPGLDRGEIEDVILGCAMPEAEQGLNVARIAACGPACRCRPSAVTVNRFCSSGLQSIAFAAERIMAGFADGDRRRRHRVDEPGADGRAQAVAEPGAGGRLPGRLPHHRPGGRESRPRARHLTRGAGRVRAAQPSARARGDRRRTLRRRDGARSAAGAARSRRGAAARHVDRSARQAAAGLPRRRHGHGRQLVADERRRRRGAGHGRGTRPRRSVSRRWRASSRTPPPASSPSGSASARCRRSARR